ncbi:hypothetical protein [Buttiauxella noackiae]|uniref:hypothetical protein n=1 Tax=Buttiauxella noackiae TaxID=82992 RepID=UPI0007E492DB|nr:hypothetical protein [Buttiauxella noackiae]
MSDNTWDGNVATLPKDYVQTLLGMLDKNDVLAVRLGLTGKGIRPNYQLIHIDNSVTAMNGANHKKFENVEEFDISRISEPLTRCDITKMLLNG